MDADELTRKLVAVGIRSPEELIHRLETLKRSDIWIFVSCEDDGTIVNATGFYPDEHQAFLAGEEYAHSYGEEPLPVTKAIPLFIDRRQIDG